MTEKITKFATMCGSIFRAGIWLLAFLFVGSMFLSGGSDVSNFGAVNGLTKVHSGTIMAGRTALANRDLPAQPGKSSKPVAVIEFNGDTFASERNMLASLVDEVIYNKDKLDSVVVVLTSGGGGVAHYGQAYAEMIRLREAGIDLTVSIDTVAASGGYWMSVPANKIVAAPFAHVGSIGVVANVMNFHHIAKAFGVESHVLTAGDRKAPITQFGEITEDGLAHMQSKLEATHTAFKGVVSKWRPQVKADKVFNGDVWTAQESIDQELGLVDEIATSHQHLFELNKTKDLVYLSRPRSNTGVFANILGVSFDVILDRTMARFSAQ